MKKKNKKGFTLIQLLAVIAIIAILFILLIPNVSIAVEKAKVSGTQTDLRSYQTAIQPHLISDISNQATEEKINRQLDKNLQFTNGESKEKSPWGTTYRLEINNNEVTIYTINKDKEPKVFGVKFKKENGEYTSEQIGFNGDESYKGDISNTEQPSTTEQPTIPEQPVVPEQPTIPEQPVVPEQPKPFVCENSKTPNLESDFTVESTNDGVTIKAYKGTSKDLVIPCKINDKPVINIGYSAFYNKGLTSLVIPNTVITIESGAFETNKLTSVVIPNSVNTIDSWAFQNNLIASLTIGNGVKTIYNSTFNTNKLTSVTIPKNVERLGFNIFYNNPNLKTVKNCTNLTITGLFNNTPTISNAGC